MTTVRHKPIKIKKRTRKIKIVDAKCAKTPQGTVCSTAFIPNKTLKTRDYKPTKKTLKKNNIISQCKKHNLRRKLKIRNRLQINIAI